jgi:penicillin-binding protein 2
MKWFNFKSPSIEKRYFLIFAVLFILSAALLGRLFMLTIVQGDDLKEASDTKRIKEVKTTAPRGNIYDRNGRLLAGTRTTFTVQLINDELRAVETPERNAILLPIRFILIFTIVCPPQIF